MSVCLRPNGIWQDIHNDGYSGEKEYLHGIVFIFQASPVIMEAMKHIVTQGIKPCCTANGQMRTYCNEILNPQSGCQRLVILMRPHSLCFLVRTPLA